MRIFEGTVKPGDTIRLMSTGAEFQLVEVGHMGATSLTPCDHLEAGRGGLSDRQHQDGARDTRVGDTVTLASNPTAEALPGFRTVTPMVFCGIYPADGADYPDLKDALEKLQLKRRFFKLRAGNQRPPWALASAAAFWGLLHMEIITERLEREFDLNLITHHPPRRTVPADPYRRHGGDHRQPRLLPRPHPHRQAGGALRQRPHLHPQRLRGSADGPLPAKRGVMVDMKYMDETRVDLHYQLPLGEIVYDFFDAIKSRSRGYASYDYEWEGWHESKLVRLDFLLNGDPVDAPVHDRLCG